LLASLAIVKKGGYMGIGAIIYGESGSGKSFSIKNLDAEKVGIINVANKPLPFKQNSFKMNSLWTIDNIIKKLNRAQADILIIDDFQYIMSFFIMSKIEETTGNLAFQKYSDIAKGIVDIIKCINNLPPQKRVYCLSHSEINDNGKEKLKTVGRLLDNQIVIEGLFSIVIKAIIINNQHHFLTKNEGNTTVKTPFEMFNDALIPNDLKIVDDAIVDYYNLNSVSLTEKTTTK
jgi:hypothetical protein